MTDISFNQSLDRLKESFLWAAAQGGNTEDCEGLIEIGADVNWKHTDGDSPLLAACRRGHTETAETLIVHGADVNTPGADSLCPIHVCCLRGDYATLNVLLSANASLTVRTKDGRTPLQLAEMKGHENICSRLTQVIAGPSTQSVASDNGIPFTDRARRIIDRPSSRSTRPLPSISPSNTGDMTESSQRQLSARSTASGGDSQATGRSTSTTSSSRDTPSADPADVSAPRSQSRGATQFSRSTSTGQTSTNNTQSGNGLPVPLRPLNALPPPTNASTTGIKPNYQILGPHFAPNHDEASIALRRQLDIEQKDKKHLENQVRILGEEVLELCNLNTQLSDKLEEMHSENADLTQQLALLSGSTVEKFVTVAECEEVEKKLKATLQLVERKKTAILAKEVESSKEQRLCVICQEGEKSVVLFPCRHMCLCQDCSQHEDLEHCPLCRRTIVQRISVFS